MRNKTYPQSKYENMKIIYNRSKFGWYWAPLYLAGWALLYFAIAMPSFHSYPTMLTLHDEAERPGEFIGERAEQSLLQLTKIGPRVVGSPENEHAAVELLLSEIRAISDAALSTHYEIEEDVQIASGNYLLWSMVNVYQSIQNVIVRVRPRDSNSSAALLINSHFDTVPGSSGAGDAGVMVAIMLETLRVLTKYETPLTHAVIFLFNGAEENPLQGSHAFITQHKWAKDVRAVINLDSAGASGRELLFQSGPNNPWLIRHYGASVPHPFANTIGEEVFQHGLVPSETDYRIFRDFGHIPGLDLAKTENGYIYHTRYDRFNALPRSVYQRTGDNLLALIKAFANAPELAQPEQYAEGHMIFFDVLGWFLIYYSEAAGRIFNIAACVLMVSTTIAYVFSMSHHTGMFKRRICSKLLALIGLQLVSILLALLLVAGVAYFVDAIGHAMSWYAQRWLLFGLYFCTMFFGLTIVPAYHFSRTKDHGLPVGYAVQLLMLTHGLFLSCIAIVLIALNVRSVYMLSIALSFYALSVLINIAISAHKKNFLWLVPHCLCQLLPCIFYMYCIYGFYMIMIPMQGRTHDTNPELLIGGFTALICLLFVPFLLPVICMFRKSKSIITLFGLCALCFVVLAITPLGFPYADRTVPQRFYAIHTARVFHNDDPGWKINRTDGGYFVLPLDRHPHSLDETLFGETNYTKLADGAQCQAELMCGYPIYSSRWLNVAKAQSYWVPAAKPSKQRAPKLTIISKQATSPTNVLFTLDISGPDHTSIFIEPHGDAKLVDWSFTKAPLEQNLPPPYFVYWSYALDSSPLRFHMEFERGNASWSGTTFSIAIIGHRLHDEKNFDDDFRQFLDMFPPWAHATAWLADYSSYKL